MSTLTSLVKSGKRKIIKTKLEQPRAEHERESIKAQQKPPERSSSSASVKS